MLLIASVASLVAFGIEVYVYTVAYPMLALVGDREFVAIHALHSNRITYSIGPALLLAFFANLVLAVERGRSASGPPVLLACAAALAGGLVLGITAFVQVPLHARLADGRDVAVLAQLNANEWMRALATFAQAGCDVALLALALRAR
jgi:hypothetical protein